MKIMISNSGIKKKKMCSWRMSSKPELEKWALFPWQSVDKNVPRLR